MSARLSCRPAPGPLENYVAQFDPLFETLAQRQALRTYLSGLLLPRERPKTLAALSGVEQLVHAQEAGAGNLRDERSCHANRDIHLVFDD